MYNRLHKISNTEAKTKIATQQKSNPYREKEHRKLATTPIGKITNNKDKESTALLVLPTQIKQGKNQQKC